MYFTARCGLALLKYFNFTLTGWQTQFNIIKHCIDNLNMQLNYAVAINLRPAGMSTTTTPLQQVKEYANIYAGMNCYEVLEKVLLKYNATIMQSNGQWLIRRGRDIKAQRLVYNYNGEYLGAENPPVMLNIGQKGAANIDTWPVGNIMQLMYSEAYRNVTITHNLQLRPSMLLNYNFVDFQSFGFSHWQTVGPLGSDLMQKYDAKNNFYFVALGGEYAGSDRYIEQTLQLPADNASPLKISAKVAISAGVDNGSTIDPDTFYIYWQVIYTNGTTTYYLSRYGHWRTYTVWLGDTSGYQSTVPGKELSWYDYAVFADKLPVLTGTPELKVRLWADNGQNSGTGVVFNYIAYADIMVQMWINAQTPYPGIIELLCNFSENENIPALPGVEIMAADGQGNYYDDYMYHGITRKTDDTPTTLWQNDGENVQKSLLQQIGRDIAARYKRALQILQGTIRANNTPLDVLIQHTYNNNRIYQIIEAQYELCEDRIRVTMHELPIYDEIVSVQVETMALAELTPQVTSPVCQVSETQLVFNDNGEFECSGNNTVQVTASPTCSWSVNTSYQWINITGGSGTGNGSFSVTCDATAEQRVGTINVVSDAGTIVINVTQLDSSCP